jgi:coenzyme F420 hydrogenase subunit beta
LLKVFGHLMKDVISPEFCLGCGACVASCPYSVLEMDDGRPKLVDRCELCGICYDQCPQLVSQGELERSIFGRNALPEETVGIYQRAFSAQTLDHEVRTHCQDGGAVTSLLMALLRTGFIDGAVVTASDGWRPVPKVAITRAELMECAGSKYSRGGVLVGLRDIVDLYSCEKVAVVGLPCQIKALRRMQTSERRVHRLIDVVKLCVGLFCARAFSYERFFKRVVEEQLDIKLTEVAKFDIKGGRLLIYRRGKPRRELAVDAIEQFVDVPCKLCLDFTAELADISIGAAGSPLGYSTVLLRTQVGTEALEIAEGMGTFNARPMEEVKPGIEALMRRTMWKKKVAKEEIERRRKSGGPLPAWIQRQSTP